MKSNKLKTLLITGSSGFLGDYYIRKCAHHFDVVYALDRMSANADASLPKNIRVLNGDLRDEDIWSKLPEKIDIVIHAAAALPSHEADEIFHTDVRATLRLAHWAIKAEANQFVHISSTAVYGSAHVPNIDESAKPRACDHYNTAKIRAEELVAYALDKTDVFWTILRPKAIVGPGRLGLFGHLYDLAYTGRSFPILGAGCATYQFLHLADLVQAVTLTVEQPEYSHQQIFNVASIADHDIATLFQSVLDRSGHGKRIKHIPLYISIPVLRAAHFLRLSPVYERIVKNLVTGSTVNLNNIISTLGYAPKHNGVSALADGYDWYACRAEVEAIESGKGHRQHWRSPLVNIMKYFL